MAASFSGSASAAFVHQDFLTPGDNRTTLDESTGLEWLKLSSTKGMSLQQVSAELNAGGRFYGWRLPTGEEVETLISGMFPTLTFNNSTPDAGTLLTFYGSYSSTWYTWMGKPDAGSSYANSFGLYYQEVNGVNKVLITGVKNVNSKVNIYDDYYSSTYSATYTGGNGVGVFLVKDDIPATVPPLVSDVPAPLAAWSIGFGAMLFGYRRKCKKSDTLTSN